MSGMRMIVSHEGVKSVQTLMWNVETCYSDAKEEALVEAS